MSDRSGLLTRVGMAVLAFALLVLVSSALGAATASGSNGGQPE